MARRPGLLGRQRRPPGVPRGDPADRVRRDRRGDRRAHRSLRSLGAGRWRDGAADPGRGRDLRLGAGADRPDDRLRQGDAEHHVRDGRASARPAQVRVEDGEGACDRPRGTYRADAVRLPAGAARAGGLRDADSRSGSRARCHEAVPPRSLRRGRERTGALYGRDLATQRRRALDNVLDRASAREPRLPGRGRVRFGRPAAAKPARARAARRCRDLAVRAARAPPVQEDEVLPTCCPVSSAAPRAGT